MQDFQSGSSPKKSRHTMQPVSGRGFRGWYYKQRAGDYMLAFIPGQASDGAFVQVIDSAGTRYFHMPDFFAKGDTVRTGSCLFSPRGVRVSLPGVEGVLHYEGLTPLSSDMMGPFSHLPMQCRHGVVSMSHRVSGQVTVDGTVHVFDGAGGYCEKDAGRSFPRSYLWLQCNDFPVPASMMLALAHIPFLAFSFTGCLAAVMLDGREYRFATYRGVRIEAYEADHVRLRQGRLVLDAAFSPRGTGQVLRAPVRGAMTGRIRESCDADLHLQLTDGDRTLADIRSARATCEIVL